MGLEHLARHSAVERLDRTDFAAAVVAAGIRSLVAAEEVAAVEETRFVVVAAAVEVRQKDH